MEKNNLKILILDDERNIVKFACKMFQNRGYETFGAVNSDEALKVFEEEKPHICIIDIYLIDSKLNGIEVLEEIRKKDKETICIMFSRITDDENIKKANDLEIFDFLVKPLEPQRLRESVARAAEVIRTRTT